MLSIQQLSYNELPLSVRRRSKDICGVDYDQLLYDLKFRNEDIQDLKN